MEIAVEQYCFQPERNAIFNVEGLEPVKVIITYIVAESAFVVDDIFYPMMFIFCHQP